MKERFRLAFHPIPEPSKLDTSLRYTDILFGFVIRELFLRLQNWPRLDSAIRWHLVVGTVLVLGSWVGYRRSLNRSGYEVKFFNLPLCRFIADQLMLIFYFRIAVLTNANGSDPPPPDMLAMHTTELILYVFVLYLVWDLLGVWMAKSKVHDSEPRYPALEGQLMTGRSVRAGWDGLAITTGAVIILAGLWLRAACFSPWGLSAATVALLVVYRFAKDVRTSWLSLPSPA